MPVKAIKAPSSLRIAATPMAPRMYAPAMTMKYSYQCRKRWLIMAGVARTRSAQAAPTAMMTMDGDAMDLLRVKYAGRKARNRGSGQVCG